MLNYWIRLMIASISPATDTYFRLYTHTHTDTLAQPDEKNQCLLPHIRLRAAEFIFLSVYSLLMLLVKQIMLLITLVIVQFVSMQRPPPPP